MRDKIDKIWDGDMFATTFVLIWAVASIAIGFYAGQSHWQEASQLDADYHALGWKQVDAKIVQLEGLNGNFKPINQQATLEYTYTSEIPSQSQQQIGLGYHTGDTVKIFTNIKGDVQVKDAPDPNRSSRVLSDPTQKSFGYSDSFFIAFFGTLAAAMALVMVLIVIALIVTAIAIIYEFYFPPKLEIKQSS